MCADYGHKRGDDSKDIKLIFNKEKEVCGSSFSLQSYKIRLSTKGCHHEWWCDASQSIREKQHHPSTIIPLIQQNKRNQAYFL
jgi:hypothetical protein